MKGKIPAPSTYMDGEEERREWWRWHFAGLLLPQLRAHEAAARPGLNAYENAADHAARLIEELEKETE